MDLEQGGSRVAGAELSGSEFQLDFPNQRLLRRGEEVFLRRKTFDVLCYLVKHRCALVTKDQLLDAAWGEGEGDDGAVRVCIGEIRKAFQDDPRSPRYIETRRKRGYRWIGLIDTLDGVAVRERLPSPPAPDRLIGRRAELAQLESCLEKALRGERQAVFVSGETGIGKTALVDGFLARFQRTADVCVAHGQCQELYGQSEAYMPVLEALERICRERADDDRLLSCLRQHAPTWLLQMPSVLNDEERQGLASASADSAPRMLREIAVALETLTEEVPMVLVLEDLHWSDGSTIDLVSALARRRNPARLLVIGTYRWAAVHVEGHPLRSAHQHLRIRRQCVDLPLAALKRSAIEKYLARKLPGDEKGDDLADLFYRLTGGNPLFLVTMVDDWLDRGYLVRSAGRWELDRRIEETGLPDSLQQMIQEKLEALSDRDQQLLEVACVAGVEFSAWVAAAALAKELTEVEEQYERLACRGRFLRAVEPEERPDGGMAGRYAFTHTLHRSVIYQRLPAARRVRLHRQIGETLRNGYEDRAEEMTAVLAMHFERGRDYRQAVEYYVLAARKALRRSAHREAIAYLSRGLDRLKFLPDDDERGHQELMLYSAFGLALMATRGYGIEEVGQLYTRAQELGRKLSEPEWRLSSQWGVAVFHLMRAEFPETRALGEQCLSEGREGRDSRLVMLGHRLIGMTRFHLGEPAAARDHLEKSFALYRAQRSSESYGSRETEPGDLGYSHLGPVLWILGFPDQALEKSREILEMARRGDDPMSVACARHFHGLVHQLRHETDEAQREAEATLAIAREHGFPLWTACALLLRGWALSKRDPEEAIHCLEECLGIWESTRSKSWTSGWLSVLAAAYGRMGEFDKALAHVAEARAAVERYGERWNEAEVQRLHGDLLFHSPHGDAADARRCFERSIVAARRQSALSWELRAVMSLSRLLRSQGHAGEAGSILAGVYGRFTEGFDSQDLKKARSMLESF